MRERERRKSVEICMNIRNGRSGEEEREKTPKKQPPHRTMLRFFSRQSERVPPDPARAKRMINKHEKQSIAESCRSITHPLHRYFCNLYAPEKNNNNKQARVIPETTQLLCVCGRSGSYERNFVYTIFASSDALSLTIKVITLIKVCFLHEKGCW